MNNHEEPKIVAEIVIAATATRIFRAIADPKERLRWWGAEGRFKVTQMESDLRSGGKWSMSGYAAEHAEFTIKGEYLMIEPPSLLEFTWLPDWEEHATIVRFDLTESNGSTTVRITHSGFKSEETRQRYQGWPLLLSLLKKFVGSETGKNEVEAQ